HRMRGCKKKKRIGDKNRPEVQVRKQPDPSSLSRVTRLRASRPSPPLLMNKASQ
ncbi:hypothetical protein HAX54_022772, partial [Datura stramonium]|nr:hypothetical protein [Datura stramonium]